MMRRIVAGCLLMFGLLAGRIDAQEKVSLSHRRVVEDFELWAAVGGGEDGFL